MTALMQALSTGPKVLRIGVVRTGRVVEERILKQRAAVGVGRSETNTFVVADPTAPAAFRLFEFSDGSYFLNTIDGMSGRVVTASGVTDLAVREDVPRRKRIQLDDEARGKVVIGGTAFLFQFVTAPPVQPRPQLPISIVRGNGIDWRTTVIAAFSFMAHFAAIGAVYSDWFDSAVDYDIVVANVIESVPYVPVADTPETPTETTSTSNDAPAPDQGRQQKNGEHARTQESGQAGLSNALDRVQMNILGVMSSSGATADVLRSGEVPTSTLDEAARRNAGVGSPGLAVAGAGPLKPGAAGPGLASISDTHGGGGEGGGTISAPKGPRGTVNAAPPDVKGAPIPNAGAVIASLRAGFRRCYERALAESPDTEGRIALSLKVGPGGEVQSVTATPQGNLSSQVVGCIRARAQSAQFDPPQGGLAVVQVPVSLVRQ
jgi:hypothetical protein